jgi:transposase
MLSLPRPTRKPAARCPFRSPLWDNDHPDFLRIDSSLPADHHARWLVSVVSHLDLTSFRRSYAGSGSLAYPVELLLAFVLFMYSKGFLSPAQWATVARYDDQAKWLLRGLLPSRSRLYVFRDRVEPFLDDWHKQLIHWAVVEGVTTAKHGSLDGSFVASLASRHQLMGVRRVDRRLLLLRLLVWLDNGHGDAELAKRIEGLPQLVLTILVLWLELLNEGLLMPQLLDTLLCLLALVELLSPEGPTPTPLRVPNWVPRSVAGRQRVLKRYEEAQKRLASKLQAYQNKKKLSKKDEEAIKRLKVSLTDPEAALGWDKTGTFRPLYNVPLVRATDAALTLGWDLLSRNNDDGLLKPMMEKTEKQVGHFLDDVRLDGAFLSVGDVLWCEQNNITVYGPPSKAEAVKAEVAKAEGKKAEAVKAEGQKAEGDKEEGQKAGVAEAEADKQARAEKVKDAAKKEEKLAKGAFRYDKQERVYYCPQGKRLEEA